ncbi:hypothetical protein [Legionella feeleii]|uniref:Uncharacterized protein n=1 Tax=Legionella feeleii TaxID=453 RepID=A0A0W0TQI2_9GAMM|nr:hypothetical protein [Legionella feeleii]KTC97922.1 hypothetical protein Lfee_1527 [Legionella feeleii]SPX62022.1 Uncharacterised protein [Legionella feeleii]
MSMEYIRMYYKVPAKRGQKVVANGKLGLITGSRGVYLRIRLEDQKRSSLYHPTWEMSYL